MDSLNNSLGKVSIGVPSKSSIFTFVPVVQTLPIESIVTEEERSGGKPSKNVAVSHEQTTGPTMSNREIIKAELVFIKDSAERGAGNTTQPGTKYQPSLDHVSLSQTEVSPSVAVQSENIPNHVAAGTASMETAVDKHRGISQQQCHDTSGLAETHKIKLSYKSLAAIPTNTLLLDQQVIDEQVEREESPCDSLDRGETFDRGTADTHAKMCSPAELRQQSEELYAVIDELLANSTPASKSSRSQQSPRSLTTDVGLQQNNSSFTKTLGRETKYASVCSLHPVERKLMNPKKTKPGVIRPMTAIPRLTVEDEDKFHPRPLRQFVVKPTLTDNKKVESMSLEEAREAFYTSSKRQTFGEERKPERRGPLSVFDLQIKEPDDQTNPPFSPTEGRRDYDSYLKY